MTDREDEIGSDEAREALAAIRETEHAGLRRAIPPRWYGAVMALIMGALIASAAAGFPTYAGLLVIALALVKESQRRRAGVSLKAFPLNTHRERRRVFKEKPMLMTGGINQKASPAAAQRLVLSAGKPFSSMNGQATVS